MIGKICATLFIVGLIGIVFLLINDFNGTSKTKKWYHIAPFLILPGIVYVIVMAFAVIWS